MRRSSSPSSSRVSEVNVEYANLTNGLLCAPPDARITRLQSTHCEQKRWNDVIEYVGVDLLASLARGDEVIVHDRSERDRVPRAIWQGLSWVRYAAHRAWIGEEPPRELSRGSMDVTSYWAEIWGRHNAEQLPGARLLYHLGPVARGAELSRVWLRGCDCTWEPWEVTQSSLIRRRYGTRYLPPSVHDEPLVTHVA